MTVSELLATLRGLGTEKHRAWQGREGAPDDRYGVPPRSLRRLARRMGANHGLAVRLWNTGNADARLFATLLCEPNRFEPEELARMAGSTNWSQEFDWFGAHVLQPHLGGRDVRESWLEARDERLALVAWRLTADQVRRRKRRMKPKWLLDRIEVGLSTAPPLIQRSMNDTRIAIGVEYADFRQRAIAIGRDPGLASSGGLGLAARGIAELVALRQASASRSSRRRRRRPIETHNRVTALIEHAARARALHVPPLLVEQRWCRTLEWIRSHPELRESAGAALLKGVGNRDVDAADLAAFCMHELRWPEVETRCRQMLGSPISSTRSNAARVLAAYDPEWSAAPLYMVYRTGAAPSAMDAMSPHEALCQIWQLLETYDIRSSEDLLSRAGGVALERECRLIMKGARGTGRFWLRCDFSHISRDLAARFLALAERAGGWPRQLHWEDDEFGFDEHGNSIELFNGPWFGIAGWFGEGSVGGSKD